MMKENKSIVELVNELESIYKKFDVLFASVKVFSPEWKKLNKQHKDACEIAAINVLENANSDDLTDLTGFIYWQVFVVKAAVLSKYLGVSGNGIAIAIGACTFNLKCDNCGEMFERTYKNRSTFEEDNKHSNKYPRPMCNKCKATFKLGKLYFDTLNELIGYVLRHPECGAKGYSVFMYTDRQGREHSRYYSRAQILEIAAQGLQPVNRETA